MKKVLSFLFLLCTISIIPVSMIAEDRIPMTLEKSGIYTIPCEVNGLKLQFVFDTGASDVHLSLVEAAFMLKNGYIEEDDFVGTGTYSMADGSISENAIVNLKTIKIGSRIINNVKACISSQIDASLLLGQSAIQKLGAYSVEDSYLVLKGAADSIEKKDDEEAIDSIYDTFGNIVPVNYTGEGKKVYSDGTIVEAHFKNGIEVGKVVVYNIKDKIRYEGKLENRRIKIKDKTYEGKRVNGIWIGQVTVKYDNGNMYVGELQDTLFHGKGVFTWTNGQKYNGDYVKGKRQGKGIYTFPDGEKYDGEWFQDQQHGKGIYYFANGNRYDGQWFKDYQQGMGTLYFNNGDIYVGSWYQDKRDGTGRLSFTDGTYYEGQWKKDLKDGYGIYVWGDGSRYEGSWREGQQNGQGTHVWSSGNKYVGHWLNGEMDGVGIYYYADGNIKSGIWKDGQCISTTSNKSSSNNIDNSATTNQDSSYSDDDDDDNYYQDEGSLCTYADVDYYMAQVTADLNLRKGPGTEYDIVTRIPRGEYVLLSTADDGKAFRKVLYIDKNIYGYVSKSYLANFKKIQEDSDGNLQIETRNYKSTADIKIQNNTNLSITIAIGSLTYTFSPHQTRTITDIKPGKYKTMASAPGVRPYIGFDTIEAGYGYSWVFYIKTTYR